MDVVGCRLNAFMERLRPIPIGCPVDELEPVGNRALGDFEWLWVDVYGEFDGGWQGCPDLPRLYDGPHLYPLETVLFLMGDGFCHALHDSVGLGALALSPRRRPALNGQPSQGDLGKRRT